MLIYQYLCSLSYVKLAQSLASVFGSIYI